jgi:hypothetical protein
MTETEINQLIERKESDKLNLFLTQVLEKARTIDKQINLTTIGIILIVLVYYLGELNLSSELQLGPLIINDTKILVNVLPFIFSFLILRFVILSSHKAEIKKVIRIFATKYFDYDNTKIDVLYTDDFSRLIMPVSIYDEIGKLNLKTKTGCISVILTLPMLVLAIVPYLILGLWLYPQLLNFTVLDFYNKVLVVGTIWLFLLSVFYFIKTMIIGVKESKE